ncbi:MAG: heme NO-binding domain-containing protein [Verrucomicrobiota bacterium]
MYGLVNKAVEGLITSKFGEETWENIKADAGVDVDIFISNESYPDDITYKLAIAASERLNMPLGDILKALGHYWVTHVAEKHYGAMMVAGGSTFQEFIANLPNFHRRVRMIFPDLEPPVFTVRTSSEHSLELIYESTREGLEDFVIGLLQGLGDRYKVNIHIQSEPIEAPVQSSIITMVLFKIYWS